MSTQSEHFTNKNNIIFSKVIRNSAASVLRFIASVPIPFLIVPFMLQKLGAERYGIWALVSILTMFVQLGDFGIGYALVKSVAEMYAKDNIDRLNHVLSTAFVFYIIMALSLMCAAFFLTDFIVSSLFQIPAHLVNDARFVVMGIVFVFSINLAFSIFTSIINGMQRMEVSNGIALGATFLNAIGVVVVLSLGFGLRGLVVNSAIITNMTILANWLTVRKLASNIELAFKNFQRKEAKEILKYGMNIQITNLAGMTGDPLIKTLITRSAGLEYVAYFEVAMRLLNPIRYLFAQAIVPLMPFAAESLANTNVNNIISIYRKSIRYLILFAIPILALIFVVLPVLIEAWVGPGYDTSIITFRILMFGQILSIISMPSFYIFLSTHVKYTMILAVINSILSLIICVILGYIYGYFGIIIGFSVAMGIISLLSVLLYCKTYHINLLSLFLFVPKKSVIFSLGLSMLFWLLLVKWTDPGFIGLILIGLMFMVIYSAYLWHSQSFSIDEIRVLSHSLKLSKG